MQLLTIITQTGNVNGAEIDGNDFDIFLQGPYLLHEDVLLFNNSEMVILVKRVCLFMGHWQRLFSISHNLVCLVLFVLFKVMF